MTISFAWTTPALVLGCKRVTRRDWSDRTIHQARNTILVPRLVKAYDKQARFGGQHVADIRLTRIVPGEDSRTLSPDQWEAEGFHVLQALGSTINGSTAAEVWRFWTRENDELQTAVYFNLIALTPYGQELQDKYSAMLNAVGGPIELEEAGR